MVRVHGLAGVVVVALWLHHGHRGASAFHPGLLSGRRHEVRAGHSVGVGRVRVWVWVLPYCWLLLMLRAVAARGVVLAVRSQVPVVLTLARACPWALGLARVWCGVGGSPGLLPMLLQRCLGTSVLWMSVLLLLQCQWFLGSSSSCSSSWCHHVACTMAVHDNGRWRTVWSARSRARIQ